MNRFTRQRQGRPRRKFSWARSYDVLPDTLTYMLRRTTSNGTVLGVTRCVPAYEVADAPELAVLRLWLARRRLREKAAEVEAE